MEIDLYDYNLCKMSLSFRNVIYKSVGECSAVGQRFIQCGPGFILIWQLSVSDTNT